MRFGKDMGKQLGRVFVALSLLLTVAAALAQTADPGRYRLRPEDIIRIQVFNQQQILADVPVGRNGYVSAPFVGSILAEGKTTNELEDELAALYKAKLKLREPIVSVTILKFRTVTATVGGFVTKPGTFEIRPGDRLLSLLNQGGGVIPDRADLRRATLRRANSPEVIPVDLYAMLILGDTSQNYEVEDGDELTIPEERRNRILVQGAVAQPGAYPYREPMTLMDAVSLAGGEVRYRSRFSRVLIIRERLGQPGQYTRIVADYVRFVKKGDQAQNVLLQPGDFVYVPETNTPDFNQISALANVAFIANQFGSSLFGFRIFNR
jgi:polysaccharide export outer membrane protein